ncbi:MAG: histidine--tRNA ligase [Candidatus Micrarchaeota archaeon]|nr:histidine--tRNA ligase [Candidatus Micrarchaeota archaeon]MDE1823730.1 histidine--tRNA ligase [Candidatus Micrarchaeota archaeon]MDE1849204.1 histidine--tRNA ligase [Candidatus Micrarchaeota archaeon]
MPVDLPRGTRDYNTAEAIALNDILLKIESSFRRFGFSPIDTPAIENLDVINAKAYGDEPRKEIYVLDGGEAGLRFDLTVPLARYMAMNKDLPLPFKRYQIGKTWRKEEPQHMRYREFVQADVDIVGSSELSSDAEVVAAAAVALESLGIDNYRIMINSRIILNAILDYFGIAKEKQVAAIRAIDKLEKLGRNEVAKLLNGVGIGGDKCDELLNFITANVDSEEKLKRVEGSVPSAKDEVQRLRSLLELLGMYKLMGLAFVDLSLARGLDYYTGFVWEFVIFQNDKRIPTIVAGGRYDNLIGIYSKRPLPAVGVSIGVSRIAGLVDVMDKRKTYSEVFIACIDGSVRDYAINVAGRLRASGICADLDTTGRNISKQLEYASSLGIGKVIIIGKMEKDASKTKLRDMNTGIEDILDVDSLISRLKG